MAVMYLVGRATDDPFVVALAIFAQLLPSAIFGLFVGPLADRLPKRWLMITADLARLLIVLAMIPAQHQIGLLLLLVFLEGIGKAVFEPARIASIPNIVRQHSIPTAVALFQTTVQTINLVGPMLAGLLLAANSIGQIFFFDAFTFLASALLLGTLSVLKEEQRHQTGHHESYLRTLVAGIREILAIDVLRFLVGFLSPITFLVGLFLTNYNSLLLQHFQVSALHFGYLEATFAAGAVLGALCVPLLFKWQVRPRGLLLAATGLLGVAMIGVWPMGWALGAMGTPVIYAWCGLAGLATGLYNVPSGSTFIQALPAHLRGRGAALFGALFNSMSILGVLVGGWLASYLGIANAIGLGGIVMVITAGLFRAVGVRSNPGRPVEAERP